MIETPEKQTPANARRLCALIAIISSSCVFIIAAQGGPPASKSETGFEYAGLDSTMLQEATGDYSKFPHANQAHSRLPCLLCHRRENNSPQPKRSGHIPCSGCHTQQFAASGGPICTICHASADQPSSAVKPFPALKSFNMSFNHSRHKNVSCATCHKPARRGVALSIPSGLSAHTTCFQCHAPRTQANGRDISSCGTCHKPGQLARAPEMRRAFRVSFSHAEHARQRLSCSECHTSMKDGMTSPAPTEHFGSARAGSCMSCHNNKRAFGEDFSSCKRCHQGPTFRF